MRVVARWSCLLATVVASTAPAIAASVIHPVPVQDRIRGAARVVVATVTDVSARYERNSHGDELIVSHVHLAVQEALKGSGDNLTVALEGGTVNGMTLRVSDLPTLSRGERAVFFLAPGARGEFVPHLRGQGILKLDSANHVHGSSLTLDEIRRLANTASR